MGKNKDINMKNTSRQNGYLKDKKANQKRDKLKEKWE